MRIKITGFIVFWIACTAPAVMAEQIYGEIRSIKRDEQTLVLERKDPSTGVHERWNVHFEDLAALDGVSDVSDLEVGDDIVVRGKRSDSDKLWQAESISLHLD